MLREDPQRQGLLYVGTERGIQISFDDGAHWQPIPGDLPNVPVYDFKIKDNDLVIATHGRAFWILDDLTPLRKFEPQRTQRDSQRTQSAETETSVNSVQSPGPLWFDSPALFPPRRSLRRWQPWNVGGARGTSRNYATAFGGLITYFEEKTEDGQIVRKMIDSGENPPQGVIVYYGLPDDFAGDLKLVFLDGDGNEIKTFRPKPKDEKPAENGKVKSAAAVAGPEEDLYLTVNPGLNRFVWEMRYPEPEKLPEDPITGKAVIGTMAMPGAYSVRLQVGRECHHRDL